MNILVIYPNLLHTRVMHGGGILMLRLIRELRNRGHHLYMLNFTLVDPEPYYNEIIPIKEMCQELKIILLPKLTPILKAIRFLIPGMPPPHARNRVQPIAQKYVQDITSSGVIDVVYVVFSAMGEYIKCVDRSQCAVVLADQEIETRQYQFILHHERNLLRWMHTFITWWRECQYERYIMKSVDQVIAISSQEQSFIRRLTNGANVEFVPPMIDVKSFPLIDVDNESEESVLLFIGSFTHPPNSVAMTWFCREVFPLIIAMIPSAQLYIVGWRSVEVVGHLADSHIQVVGPVEDIRSWLAKTTVFVSPIRSGGGARMKNLEALAVGVPLVTTSLGAEGLADPPGSAYLVADEPIDFADAVISLLSDKAMRCQFREEGRRMVERAHDTQVVVTQVESLLQKAIRSKRRDFT